MLKIETDGSTAKVTLDRPEVHNAFNDELIPQVTETFEELGANKQVRVIVLAGNGKSFCAGGDLNWMKRMVDYTFDENVADATVMAGMFRAIATCPKPVIGRVHGSALGGGAGVVAAVDIAVAVDTAKFGFTEVKLGIIPGVISAVVVARIGAGRAREFFTTGERFSAEVAHQIGLVHQVVEDDAALDAMIEEKIRQIMTAAPGAIAEAKKLIAEVSSRPLDSAIEYAAEAIARARASEEGQAGMKAFLSREKPPWVEK
jgi:methylglutaconyl-CoA hydratase